MVLLLLAVICHCCVSAFGENIETRIHSILIPGTGGDDFGRSLQGTGTTLFASATDPSSGGAMYNCSMTYHDMTMVTRKCSQDNGFMGAGTSNSSKYGNYLEKVTANGKDYLVACGNQYMFECPSSNITQRMVGQCISFDTIQRTQAVLSSPCPTGCIYGLSADIVFVIDGSGSVGSNNYKKGLEWITEVLKQFRYDIDKGRIRVGYVPFASGVYSTKIVASKNYYELKDITLNLPYKTGGTYSSLAIEKGASFLENALPEKDVAKMMITMTDGEASSKYEPKDAAQNARDSGITMIAVGIGSRVSKKELEDIAGDVSRVVEVRDYNALNSIIQKVGLEIEKTASAGLEGSKTNATTELTNCQFGSSIYASSGGLYIGAVGSYSRLGSVAEYHDIENFPDILSTDNLNSTEMSTILGASQFEDLEEYFGYSVSSGKFSSDNINWTVTGAPRYLLKGMVLIYRETTEKSYHSIFPPAQLWQLGAYFGHSVFAIDVNNDGIQDLVVSSPLYSEKTGYDEGRVFVFTSNLSNPSPKAWANVRYSPTILQGENVAGARFGMQIAYAGDIDKNGIDDVIVSSPAEESLGRNTKSGAIYIYFSSRNTGLSDSKKQKILGSSVSNNRLSQFGWSVHGGADFDDNGYPDIAVSAPSSKTVVLLRSRKIIVLTSSISVYPVVIDVMKCARSVTSPCSNITMCLSAVFQNSPSSSGNFEMTYTIDLDSLVPGDKRLQFLNPRGASISQTLPIGRTQTCNSYEMYLNTDNLGKISAGNGLQVNPRVTLNVDLSQKHKNTIMSGILSEGSKTKKSEDWTFDKGCNGTGSRCEHDLKITATSSDEGISGPIVLDDKVRKLRLSILIENRGPDRSYFTKLNVSSGDLSLNVINGSCVESVDSESDSSVGLTVIRYKSNVSLLTDLMASGDKCNFVLEFDFTKIKQVANDSKYKITGLLYSSVGNTSAVFDADMENNRFSFSHDVQYKSTVSLTPLSLPEAIYFNRTRNTTDPGTETINSLEDYALGGNATKLTHQYTLYNRGPLSLAKTQVSLTWPEYTNRGLDLLYLLDVKCEPAAACTCNTTGRVNKFNIAPKAASTSDYFDNYTVTYPGPGNAFGATTKLTCDNSRCSALSCDMKSIALFETVQVVAEFKPWIPTFGQDFTETEIFSTLDLIVTNVTFSNAEKRQKAVTVLSTSPWYREPSRSDIPWWIVFLAVLGGLLLLNLAVLGLWKAGFFESKYKNKTRAGRASVRGAGGGPVEDAPGDLDLDPGVGHSIADLVDG